MVGRVERVDRVGCGRKERKGRKDLNHGAKV